MLEKEKEGIEQLLLDIEQSSGKHIKKWQKTRKAERLSYMREILRCARLKHSLFYGQFDHAGKEYLTLTIYSLSKLVFSIDPNGQRSVSVVIDALTQKERQAVGRDLRRFGIRTDKIRGKKDESSPMLRLADALAGFVRDGIEKQADFADLFDRAVRSGKLSKIN